MLNLLLCFCLWASPILASTDCPSSYVSESVWEQVSPYLMPDNHPIKKTLDEIVSEPEMSVFYDMESMTEAGFAQATPQPQTKLIVTRHPRLKGYVIKAYLDVQKYYDGRPEYYYWIKRVQGARLIRDAIGEHHFEHLLKVPAKWIYLLPDKPAPYSKYKHKMFILVEEDMDILDDKASKARWGSAYATKELLSALHTIITEFRFRDCAKPANCPFSKDGRVALVDTQSFYKKRVGYWKLTPYLTPEMQAYWEGLEKSF